MIGYDPQRALLTVKLQRDGKTRQYEGVSEDVWYSLREKPNPDVYYRRCICGHYPERVISE